MPPKAAIEMSSSAASKSTTANTGWNMMSCAIPPTPSELQATMSSFIRTMCMRADTKRCGKNTDYRFQAFWLYFEKILNYEKNNFLTCFSVCNLHNVVCTNCLHTGHEWL